MKQKMQTEDEQREDAEFSAWRKAAIGPRLPLSLARSLAPSLPCSLSLSLALPSPPSLSLLPAAYQRGTPWQLTPALRGA
eukprot:3940669-Rhodomonas_salina.7